MIAGDTRWLATMPKVDLHRHLEGAIRLSTLVEIARTCQIDLPARDPEGLRPFVQMTSADPRTVDRFMGKFEVLRRFYRSPEIIRRITAEAIADAAADRVRYLELRFTPWALASQMRYRLTDVVGWVCDAAAEAAQREEIRVGLVVSLSRHEPIELGLQTVQAALEHRDRGVVGLDLSGQEGASFPARPFGPLFLEAKQAGLGITIHAGEWHGPEHVREAIEHMHADRIGHGVRIVEDSAVVQLARQRGVAFEVCPTSNLQTGSVRSVDQHPLCDLRDLGLPVTINTDDPAVSGITLTDEYTLALTQLGFSPEDLRTSILTAARASFLPAAEKERLMDELRQALARHAAAYGDHGAEEQEAGEG